MKKLKSTTFIILVLLYITLLASCEQVKQLPLIKSAPTPDFKISKCSVGHPTKLLKANIVHPPLTFNPITAMDDVSKLISSQLSATLFKYNPINNSFEPNLAKDFVSGPKNKLFTIHLRKNISFSDGTPFTADDVLTTINYILNPDVTTSLRSYLIVDGKQLNFSKIDNYTIRCVSPVPIYSFEAILSKLFVLPGKILLEAASTNRLNKLYSVDSSPENLISIGPYIVKSYSSADKKIVLQKNPRYWVVDSVGRILPYIERVVIEFVATSQELSLKFRTGETDVIDNMNPSDAKRLMNIKGLKIFDTGPSVSTYIAWFNQNLKFDPKTHDNYIPKFKLKWFTDINFRKAVSKIFDRNALARKDFDNLAIPTQSLTSPLEEQWATVIPLDIFSISSMRKMLASGSYIMNNSVTPPALYAPNKLPVQFTMTVFSGDDFSNKIGSNLETSFEKAGIKATMVSLPYDLFYPKIYQSYDYDLAIMRISIPQNPYFIKDLVYSSSSTHLWYPQEDAPASKEEKEMDATVDKIFTNPSWQEKYSAYHKIENLLNKGKFIIPILKPHGLYGAKGKIQNLNVNFRTTSILWNLEELYSSEE